MWRQKTNGEQKEMTKIVLIGGPSSGKSTLINMLAEKGYNTIPEVAKDLILSKGGITPEDKLAYENFQNEIAVEQLRREKELYSGDLTFFDRGIYDGIVYSEKFLGHIPRLAKKLIDSHTGYDRIFALARLPFLREGFRVEKDDVEAQELHERIVDVYRSRGYDLEFIPVLPREERLNYLLERIK